MKKRFLIAATIALFGVSGVAYAAARFSNAVPSQFDPGRTKLVNAAWLSGIGCPTNAKVVQFIPPDFTETEVVSYTDPACATGDPKDKMNEGLLLAKTGPTNNNAAAQAHFKGVKGIVLTELGYDIRKPGSELAAGARGSHCGAGAPRFNVQLEDMPGNFFIGCNSPPADSQIAGAGFVRLRWGGGASTPIMAFGPVTVANPTGVYNIRGERVRALEIVFDEGYDTGPDNFGLAVLDNIDVNGVLIGRGPTQPN